MFDAQKIADETIDSLVRFTQELMNKLFIGGAEISATIDPNYWQVAIYSISPVREQIDLLCRVANGELDRVEVSDLTLGEVRETIHGLCETLFIAPGSTYHYEIPVHFWDTQLGQVVQRAQIWLAGDELITLTEAAILLFPDLEVQAARMRIKRMIERGELDEYRDPEAKNPQHDVRVAKSQVEGMRENDTE